MDIRNVSPAYFVENAALSAIDRMQEAFKGEAERLGLKNEDDVTAMIKEIRRDRWEKRPETAPQNN